MRNAFPGAILLGLMVLFPVVARAQIGVAGGAGTLGVGPAVSIAVSDRIALRGGVGFVPVEFSGTFSDFDYTIDPPATIWSAGLDLFPGLGSMRLSAGVLHRPRYQLAGQRTGSATIGNQTYTGTIDLRGTVRNKHETAPYVALGFGRMTGRGVGMFVDLGAAFVGDADIELSGSCTLSGGQPCPGDFQADVEREAAQAEADLGRFLKLHPILQVGITLGL